MKARNDRKSVAWHKSYEDPEFKKLGKRKSRELAQYYTSNYWGD